MQHSSQVILLLSATGARRSVVTQRHVVGISAAVAAVTATARPVTCPVAEDCAAATTSALPLATVAPACPAP